MKKLNLEVIPYQKKYRINTGNGKYLVFDTKTQSEKYLRKYKRVLRDNVKMLNLIQPNINAIYRQNYFQFKDYEVREFNSLFQSFDDRFEYSFKNFSSGNKNGFVFNNINSCFSYLIQIVELLHVHGQKNKNYGLTSQTVPILKHLQTLRSTFNADKRSMLINESYKKLNRTNLIFTAHEKQNSG